MATKSQSGLAGGAAGAAIGTLVPGAWGSVALGGLLGGSIGSLFGGSKKKKDPYAWYRKNPQDTLDALQKNMKPQQYVKYKPMFDLISQYQAEQDETNQANELRYQQGLGIYGDVGKMYSSQTFAEMPEDTYDYGQAARGDIKENLRLGTASDMQRLVSSGLYNTSLSSSVAANNRDKATRQLMQLDEDVAKYKQGRIDQNFLRKQEFEQNKLANLANAYTGKAAWIGSKTDTGPDATLFSNMMSLYAQKPGVFGGLTSSQKAALTKVAQKSLSK